jgi:SAM-dependent methyltransferase
VHLRDILLWGPRLLNRRVYRLTQVFSRYGLYRFMRAEIKDLNQRREGRLRVLNVGSGGAVDRWVARVRDSDIVSVDIDPERHPDMVADVCEMTCFDGGTFDVVFMIEVLEHVHSPKRAVAELRRVLKEGGVLLLSTPFVFGVHDAPYDFFRYTRHGLELLLSDFRELVIAERDRPLHAVVIQLMRTYFSPFATDRIVALGLIGAAIVLYPVVWLLDRVLRSRQITSGYVVRCIK